MEQRRKKTGMVLQDRGLWGPQEKPGLLRIREGSRGPQREQFEGTASSTCFLCSLGGSLGDQQRLGVHLAGEEQHLRILISPLTWGPLPSPLWAFLPPALQSLACPAQRGRKLKPSVLWVPHPRPLLGKTRRFAEIFYSTRKTFIVSSKPQKPKVTNESGNHSEVSEQREQLNTERETCLHYPRVYTHPQGRNAALGVVSSLSEIH